MVFRDACCYSQALDCLEPFPKHQGGEFACGRFLLGPVTATRGGMLGVSAGGSVL